MEGENAKVVFNVGGLRYETFESTLRRFPATLLGSAASREPFYDPRSNEYFFDRNRNIFDSILYYYQSNGKLLRPDDVPEAQFLNEVSYFRIGRPGQYKSYLECVDLAMLGDQSSPPAKRLQRLVWDLFNWPSPLWGAKIVCGLNIVLLVLSISVGCLESMKELQHPAILRAFDITDHVCYGWFTIEFVARISVAANKRTFMESPLNVIDLISLVPYYVQLLVRTRSGSLAALRALRLFRVVRVMKFTRYSTGMRALIYTLYASRKELMLFSFILMIILVLSASLVYFAEGRDSSSLLKSVPEAMWWSINTISTVGYGDTYPRTDLGKGAGGLVTLLGAVVIGLPIYCFVSNFLKLWESIKSTDQDEESDARKAEPNQMRKMRLGRLIHFVQAGTPERIHSQRLMNS